MVGVLLMLAVIVALGTVVYAFGTGSMQSLSQNYAAGMNNQKNAAAEQFKIEQVAFTFLASPALDGSATNSATGTSSSIAATLSTSSSNDVIIAYVSPADTGSSAPPAVSGISGGGLTWTHRVTTPTETFTGAYYISFILTNSQASATPNPFQQKVTWNPSTYSADETADLGNIRFCADSVCNTPLSAWLESCSAACAPSNTSATAWVKLTSSIAGSGGTMTVYMVFFQLANTEFDGVQWGEAPNLSGTYGKYDNGANVFNFYDNFAGTTLSSKWTTVASGGGSVTVNNGATIAAASNADYAFVASSAQTSPQVAESYFVSESSAGIDPNLGVSTSTSYNGAAGGTALNNGYEVSPFSGTLYLVAQSATGYTVVTSGAEAFHAGIWQLIWWATGHQSGSDGSITLTGADGSLTIGNYGIYLGISAAATGNVVFDWGRMRAYPPSGAMPSQGAFSATSTTSSTFDVEEWYATSGSALSLASITANLASSDTAETWITVFGVSGANTASPFDPSLATPPTASGTSNVQTTMSTTNSQDMLLYGCGAGAGSMAAGFASITSSDLAPYQNDYVGYERVSAAQTNLVTSCGGANTYGAEITDALENTPTGADVYVRNVGSSAVTLAAVYVSDTTSGTPVSQATVPSTSLLVGTFVEIPHTTVTFTPTHGHAYSFVVTSSLGTSQTFSLGAT